MEQRPRGFRTFAIAAGLLLTATRPLPAQAPVVLTLAQAVDEALVKNDRLVDQRDGIHRPTLVRGRSSIAIDREVEVAQLRYDTGLSNNLDVVSAESRLMLAESRRIQALADAAVARLRLRALLGVFDPHADIP